MTTLAKVGGRLYNQGMARLTLEYWTDDGWYVGRLREAPSVISQGRTFTELKKNIRDAFRTSLSDRPRLRKATKATSILLSA